MERLKLVLVGKILFFEQEGGYADPAIQVGGSEGLSTVIGKAFDPENVYREQYWGDGPEGRFRVTIEKIGD